jgi:hypothetical protein
VVNLNTTGSATFDTLDADQEDSGNEAAISIMGDSAINLVTTTDGFDSLTLEADSISFTPAVTAASDINLTTDALTVTSTLTSTSGDINISTRASGTAINVGDDVTGGLDITEAELANLSGANLTLTAQSADVSINDTDGVDFASAISGDVSITTGADVNLNGVISVPGNLTLAAANVNSVDADQLTAADINLNVTGDATFAGDTNAISGTISTGADSVGGSLVVDNTLATDLGTLNTSGLSVTAGGAVTDSGVITATGATTVTATGFDITLDSNNDFSSIALTGANGSVTDANDINVAASTLTGSLTVNASGAVDIAASSATDLTVTTTGNVTDSGVLTISGATTVTGADITLDAANQFASIAVTGDNVSITDADALVLNGSTVSGDLAVTTGGAITDGGAISVAGATTINAGGADITLADAGSDYASIALTGANVAVTDVNGLDLAASTVSGTLGVTADGDVTDSGTVAVTGATTINTSGNVTLDEAASDYASLGVKGGNVGVTEGNGSEVAE